MEALLPKNFADRQELMSEGMAELRLWLTDRVSAGLADLLSSDTQPIEAFASRLVDTKLGSIAKRLRLVKESADHASWPDRWTIQLSDWYLLTKAWPDLFTKDEALQFEILQIVGLNIRKKDLLTHEGTTDDWFVYHIETGTEEQLRFRRTWLYGLSNNAFGCIIDYVWGEGIFEDAYHTGEILAGEIVYYPAPFPVRAVLRPGFSRKYNLLPEPGKFSHDELTVQFARMLGEDPWLTKAPFLTSPCRIRLYNQKAWIIDSHDHALPLAGKQTNAWRWIALTAKEPASFLDIGPDELSTWRQPSKLVDIAHKPANFRYLLVFCFTF